MAIDATKHRRWSAVWNDWTWNNKFFRPTPETPTTALTANFKATQEARMKGSIPGTAWVSVTPDDSNDLPQYAIAFYITGAGTLTVVDVNQNTDATTTLYPSSGSLNAGVHAIQARRVMATGTTATGIEALVPVTVTKVDH
jgi:hypothetical protein